MLKFLKGKSSKHEGKEDEEKHKAKKSSKDEKKHKKDKKKEKAASMGSLDGAGATTETRKIKKEKRKQKAASMASLDGSGPTIEKKKWRFGKKKTYEIGEAGGVTSVTKTTETRTETRPGGKTVTTTEVRTTRTRSDQRHPGVLLVQADKHDERAGRITDWNQEVDISGNRETSKIHVQKENGKRMENGKEFREDARIRSSNEEELISPEDKIESLQGETGPRNKVVTPGGKVVLIVTRKTSSGGKPAAVSDGKNVDRGNKMDPPKNVSPQMEKDIVKEEVNVQNAERSVDLPSWLEEVKEGDKPKDKMDGTVDIAFDVQGRNKPSLHSEPAVVETVKEEQVENSPEIDWSKLEDPQRRNTFTKTIITKRVKVDLPGNARQEDIPDGSTPQKWLVDVEKSPAKTPTGSDHNKGPLHVDVSLTDTKHSANDFQSQKQGMRPRTLPADGAPYIEKHLENDVSDSTQSAPGPWADMPASPGRKNILIVTRKTSSGEKPASATEKNGKDVGREKKMDSPKNMSPQTEKDRVKEEVNVQNVERSVDLPSWLEEVKEGDKPKDKMDGTVDIAFDVQGRNKPSLHSEPAVVETVKEEQVENSPEIDWSKLEDPQRRNTFTKTIITKRVKVTIPGNISQEDFTDGSSQTSEKYADMTPKRRSGIWLVDIHRSPANKTSEFEHRDPFHVDLSVSDPERSVDSYVTDGLEAEPTESRQEFTEDVDKVITTDSEPQIIHLSLESSPGSRDVTTTSEKRKSRDKYPKLEYITSLDLEDIEVLKSPDKQRPELQRQDVVTRTLTQSAVNELHTSPQNGAEPVDYKKGAKKIPGRKDSSDSSSSESDSDHEEGNLRSKMRKAEFHTNGLPGSSHHDYEPVYAAVDFDAKRKKRTETGRVGKQAHSEPESNYEKLKFPHQSDYMKLQYPTKITTTNDEQVKTDNGPAHKQHFSMVDVTVGQDSTDGFQETRVRDSLPVKVEMHQRSDDGTTSSSSSDSEGMADKKEQLRRAEQQARPTHGIRPKNWDIREKGTEIYQGENLSNRGSEDLKYWEIVGERDQANKELEFDVTTKETYKPAREGFVHRQLIYHAPKTDTTDLPRQSGTARENGLIEKRTMRTTTTITNGDGKTVTTTTRDVTDDKATRTTKTVTSEHTDNAEHVDERVSAWASDGNNDPSVRMKDPSVEFTKTRRAQETGKAVEVQPPRTASKELLADFEVFRSKQQAPNKAVGRSDEVTNEVAVSHQSRRIVESETVRKGTAQELHSENSALDIDSISSEGPGDTDMSRRIITTTQVSTTRRSGPDGKTTTTTREVVDSGGRQRVTESTRTSPGIGRYDYTSARRNITEYSPSQSINTESSPSRSTRTDRFDRSYSPRKYDLEKPRANGDEDGEITEEIVVVNKKKKVRLPKNFLDPEPSKPPRATIPLDKLVDAPARKKKEPVRYRNQVRENVRPSQSEKREAPDLALLEKITRELGKNKN